jgi:type VI secretion system protein ImpF
MPELASSTRLQPALLDRLTDLEPENSQESRDRRVLSLRQLKAAVLRDLVFLLNTGCQRDGDLAGLREVEKSVLNFGVPSLSGRTASGVRPMELEQMLASAITRYEPRILPRTVKVRVVTDTGVDRPNTVALEIEGSLWAQPMPEALYIRTKVDLETGDFSLEER